MGEEGVLWPDLIVLVNGRNIAFLGGRHAPLKSGDRAFGRPTSEGRMSGEAQAADHQEEHLVGASSTCTRGWRLKWQTTTSSSAAATERC